MSDIVIALVQVLSLQEFKLGLDTGYIVAQSHLNLAAIQEDSDTRLIFESTSDIADCIMWWLPAPDSSTE